MVSMEFYSKAAMERAMKVQEVILRALAKKITWWQAAEIIGISDRHMRRWRERYEEFGYDGLFDRRRGKPSPRRVPVATVKKVFALYRETYFDLNVQHFHEKLKPDHGIELSYTWVKQALQGAGLVGRGRKRGVHRKRRERRPPLAAFAMHSAFASPPHQTRSLQRLLHPGIAQFDPVIRLQLLVKVLHVQIEIRLPVECKHLLHRGHRYPSGRGLAPAPIIQSVVSALLVPLPPPPPLSIANPDDLRRLPPRDLLRQRPQNHFLDLHCPLHRGLPSKTPCLPWSPTLTARKADISRAISTGHMMNYQQRLPSPLTTPKQVASMPLWLESPSKVSRAPPKPEALVWSY